MPFVPERVAGGWKMVRTAREEIRTLFGVDLDRLLKDTFELDCGFVRFDGVLWHRVSTEVDSRLEWFLVEMAKASDYPALLYLELAVPEDDALEELEELLPSRNCLLFKMTSRGRRMMVYHPWEDAGDRPHRDRGP